VSEAAVIVYKTTNCYSPQHERGIRWDDPRPAIPWPLDGITPRLSAKDAAAPKLAEADVPPAARSMHQIFHFFLKRLNCGDKHLPRCKIR
jgi:hypothetical protein